MEPEQALVPIPSDLHVLGLPLAFILSQDQTLHCKMKFLIPTIYIIRILFYISDLGPNPERILEFVHDFRLSSVYSSRLHDCVFLKNFCASTSVSAIFRWAPGPSLSFFVSLRFRWDCKGRNLF